MNFKKIYIFTLTTISSHVYINNYISLFRYDLLLFIIILDNISLNDIFYSI